MNSYTNKVSLNVAFVQLREDGLGVLVGEDVILPAIFNHVTQPLLTKLWAKVKLNRSDEYVMQLVGEESHRSALKPPSVSSGSGALWSPATDPLTGALSWRSDSLARGASQSSKSSSKPGSSRLPDGLSVISSPECPDFPSFFLYSLWKISPDLRHF